MATKTFLRLSVQRTLVLICVGTAAAFVASAETGVLFPGIPFERWLADGGRPQIRWTTHVSEPELSVYQRLQAKIEISVDGDELVKRKGHGQLMVFLALEDRDQKVYRTGQKFDLENVEDAAGKSNITITQAVFLMPGDYRLSMGVLDAENGEHSVAQRTLHVAPLRRDPLPEAWKNLPPVEIVKDPSDEIFLPSSTATLNLPLDNHRPVQIELLVNTSRSIAGMGPRAGQMTASSLGRLIPAMKVISQIAVNQGRMNVAVLDLARQKVVFESGTEPALDWTTLRDVLTKADSNTIDVHSLKTSSQDAHFFVTQVSQRIESASTTDTPHVIIVLSGPMAFAPGVDLHPIRDAEKSNTHIYYLRYNPPPVRTTPLESFERSTRGRRGRNDPFETPSASQTESLDSLANTIKPLHPHLFDVYTPEQFRKALSTMLDEISRL